MLATVLWSALAIVLILLIGDASKVLNVRQTVKKGWHSGSFLSYEL